MAGPAISVLIPHLRQGENDKALKICIETLIDNTAVDYEIIIEAVAERRDIYPVCNEMAARAKADYIVFHNSDVFVAPGWAEAMLAEADPNMIVAGVIVECGAIGVASANVHHNFGMTPDSFDRVAFEAWVRDVGTVPSGPGWYFPSLHPKSSFLDMGGFVSIKGGFMKSPCDANYWSKWRAAGKGVTRVRSFSYHLQNYSTQSEQDKPCRHGG